MYEYTSPLGGVAFLPAVGLAAKCTAAQHHTPIPLRFVWHHILPRVCGGKTTAANLAPVCDSCHYAIHVLLFELKNNTGALPRHFRLIHTGRAAIAQQGYQAAVAAGTADKIPNEGMD